MYKLVALSIVLAIAAANPSGLLTGPTVWGGVPFGGHLGAPIVHAGPAVAITAPLHGGAHNYRGPLSLAPGQPANIIAHDGRPLDTLSVNADRALHYTARAFDHVHGVHSLGKRSAPAAWSHTARIDVPAVHGPVALGFPAVAHAATWRAPLAPLAVGHLGAWSHAGIWAQHW